MDDITTGTGDFVAEGVVSHNCFARPTHTYLDLDADRDFRPKIVVKVNAFQRLRAELAPKRWAGHHFAMGTNTDPYQHREGKYRLTQGIVETLSAARNLRCEAVDLATADDGQSSGREGSAAGRLARRLTERSVRPRCS